MDYDLEDESWYHRMVRVYRLIPSSGSTGSQRLGCRRALQSMPTGHPGLKYPAGISVLVVSLFSPHRPPQMTLGYPRCCREICSTAVAPRGALGLTDTRAISNQPCSLTCEGNIPLTYLIHPLLHENRIALRTRLRYSLPPKSKETLLNTQKRTHG
jgi:hypothetical protein